MVSFGKLLIPATACFREDRIEPLIQHEIGTHVLTYRNGDSQPLKLMAVGLPSYEETQEGLAVLAEYVVGGLDPRRMRVLAARVVAAAMMLADADFVEIFRHLTDDHGFAPRTAWSLTSRVDVRRRLDEGHHLSARDRASPRILRRRPRHRSAPCRQALARPCATRRGADRARRAQTSMGASTLAVRTGRRETARTRA